MNAINSGAAVVMGLGLVFGTTEAVQGQEATIQASVTVVAPVTVPEVRVESQWIEGRAQPVLVVEGAETLRLVGLKIEGTESEPRRVGQPGALGLEAARASGRRDVPVEMVFAVN